MLDVIITVSENTPKQYVTECFNSIKVAIKQTPYPVRLVEATGVPGHIGQAMHNGLVQTSAPYVCWVDDDDFVLPNAFAVLERHFDANPKAVCAREIRYLQNGRLMPNHGRHHLTAWRRDIPESSTLVQDAAKPLMRSFQLAWDDIADEMSWVYVYRIRRSGGMALRSSYNNKTP